MSAQMPDTNCQSFLGDINLSQEQDVQDGKNPFNAILNRRLMEKTFHFEWVVVLQLYSNKVYTFFVDYKIHTQSATVMLITS